MYVTFKYPEATSTRVFVFKPCEPLTSNTHGAWPSLLQGQQVQHGAWPSLLHGQQVQRVA